MERRRSLLAPLARRHDLDQRHRSNEDEIDRVTLVGRPDHLLVPKNLEIREVTR